MGRVWPPTALVLLLGVVLLRPTGDVLHLDQRIFIGLLFLAEVAGWIAAAVMERIGSPRSQSNARPKDETRAPEAGQVAYRTSRWARATVVLVLAAIVAWSVRSVAGNQAPLRFDADTLGVLAGVAFAAGGAARLAFGSRAVSTQLVIAAALAAWGYLDAADVPYLPFRDLGLYLDAGAAWLDGRAVYLAEPVTSAPAVSRLPFVYPPFVLPFFAALSRLPHVLAIAIWEILAVAATILALNLLGVRRRWILPLILWPPLAVGLSVGNAAPFGLLGLAAGWRWGAALVLAGIFKPQAALPALWLVRERRWRALALGVVGVGGLALVTVPLTGITIYADWAMSLGAFEETVRRFSALQGAALLRYLPEGATVAIVALAAVAAFVTSGRMALSRFAIVAVAASPTLYVHGFAPLLVAALWLDAASFWLIAGILPSLVFFIPDGPAIWGFVAVTGGALLIGLTRAARGKRSPGAMPLAHRPADSALHPLGANLEPWPK